ncbi:MAG TPA: hypothetical protein VFA07_18495 [Chthonomonadaceae bacterium]|nr:hypothetical protein [Chthonomonadaceae bacterium]
MKVCPLCAEWAPVKATHCRQCGIRVMERSQLIPVGYVPLAAQDSAILEKPRSKAIPTIAISLFLMVLFAMAAYLGLILHGYGGL